MDINHITSFEDGTISDEDLKTLFQELVDTGNAWTLQGFYGRTACKLIAMGLVEVKDASTIPPMAVEHIRAIKQDLSGFENAMRGR